MKRFIIIASIIGIITTIALCTIFHYQKKSTAIQVVHKQLKPTALEPSFVKREINLTNNITQLKQREILNENQLNKVQKKQTQLLKKHYEWSGKQQVYKQINDTNAIIAQCDSLQQLNHTMIENSNMVERIQSAIINNLKEQLLYKDSIITLKHDQCTVLQNENSMYQSNTTVLQQTLKNYKKRYRQQQGYKKIKKVAVIAASIFIGKWLINK